MYKVRFRVDDGPNFVEVFVSTKEEGIALCHKCGFYGSYAIVSKDGIGTSIKCGVGRWY